MGQVPLPWHFQDFGISLFKPRSDKQSFRILWKTWIRNLIWSYKLLRDTASCNIPLFELALSTCPMALTDYFVVLILNYFICQSHGASLNKGKIANFVNSTAIAKSELKNLKSLTCSKFFRCLKDLTILSQNINDILNCCTLIIILPSGSRLELWV